MSPTPDWVKALKPSTPAGTDLLKAERDKSQISVDKLSNFLFTREVLERQQRILEILQSEKIFDKSQNYFDGRVDKFKTALARAKKLRQLQVKHNWNNDEYMTAYDLVSETGPYVLHIGMYLVCYAWIVRCSRTNRLPDDSSRSRHSRAEETLPRACRELRGHWLLCTDRVGPWLERSRPRDHRHVES